MKLKIINFLKLFSLFEMEQKNKFFILIFYMIIYSLLEIISIGLLIPFVTIILSPERVLDFQFINDLFFYEKLMEINLQVFFTLSFIATVLISNMFRIFVVYKVGIFAKSIPLKLSIELYKNIITSKYKDFKKRNSSELISLVTDKMDSLQHVFTALLNATASLITSIGIIAFLLFLNYKIAIICFVGGILIYSIIGYAIKKTLNKNSIILRYSSINRIKHVSETFGSIKQIMLEHKENLLTKIFQHQEKNYRKAQFIHSFFNSSPRFVVEAFGIILISAIILFLSVDLKGDGLLIIATVGVIAYAFQKLLPNFNTIYTFYVSFINYSSFVEEFVANFDSFETTKIETKYAENNKSIIFTDKIELNNISFKYNLNDKEIIKSKYIEIKKGSKVCFIGETGSGKSTCLDILMGLLKPTKGFIKIDGNLLTDENIKVWQNKISHVPQDIFLLDATIRENIMFNFNQDNIDIEEIIESAKIAEIHDFINTLPEKYETKVGEKGALLSGGQRQRIGIARAIYQKKEILTLDEATNALDDKTEKKVLNNLNNLKGITIIQITHGDISNLNFDKIFNF